LTRHYSDHGHAFLDESYRAVLELTRGIALRVEIADLLELQGPLQSNCNPDSSSDEQNVGGHRVALGGSMNVILKQQSLCNLIGKRSHRLDRLRQLVRRHRRARLGQIQGQQIERDQLTGEGLRCGHTDLGSRVCEQNCVGFSGYRGTHDVRHCDDAGTHLFGESQRRKRVCSFTGLSNCHNQGSVVEDRIAISELGGKVELDREASPVLDRMLCSHPGMKRGATRHDYHLSHATQRLVRPVHLVEGDAPRLVDARTHSVASCVRLLEYLFEHEILEAATFGRGLIPLDRDFLDRDFLAGERERAHLARADLCHLVVVQRHDFSRVREQGRNT